MTATDAISTAATHAVRRQRSPAGRSALARLIARIEAVADRPHGHNRRAPAVGFAELASQIADIHVDDVGSGVVVVAPDRAQNLLTREDMASVAQQIHQEFEFGGREPYQGSVAAHFAREEIDL